MRPQMPTLFVRLSVAALASAIAGCAASVGRSNNHAAGASGRHAPTTQTASVEQLESALPEAKFPATRPVATTEPAPLEALELFARGRAALDDRKFPTAIENFEKAIKIDPDSFALRYALAETYVTSDAEPKAIQALEAAEALNPRHLELQTELGRQFINAGDIDQAIFHLRLAMQTDEYREDDELAALTDYMLARAFRGKGNDVAALQMLEQLVDRLRQPSMAIRSNRDLLALAQQPEALFAQMGELYARLGDAQQAAVALEVAADRRPDNFDYQTSLVDALLASGRTQTARQRAADVVQRFRANPESLKLLRKAYQGTGKGARGQGTADQAVINELRKLVKDKPTDQGVVFALVELLTAQGKTADAQAVLTEATTKSGYEIDYVRRLFAIEKKQGGDANSMAKLIVEAHARHPDAQDELEPLWTELLRRRGESRLKIGQIQALDVSEEAEAAKLFWVASLAQLWNRDLLARSSLEQSAGVMPPFAPTYRMLIGRIWARDDWDEARKTEESEQLIAAATDATNRALAGELRGLLLIRKGQPQQAVQVLQKTFDEGAASPQVRIALAAAMLRANLSASATQLLWKVIDDHPTFEEAYNSLFAYYFQVGDTDQAAKVLHSWRAADPANVNARLLEALIQMQGRQFTEASSTLEDLFAANPDNPDVLSELRTLYETTGRTEEFMHKLNLERGQHPDNRVALEMLIDMDIDHHRVEDAKKTLGEVRQAVSRDPDLLYYVANLYGQIGDHATTEQILGEVIAIDPTHAPASNDLGYTWADQGKNMERAESLIRVAVEAEPDNQSYLDSLGWVLYKRSKFSEAAERLQAAVAPATFPDPVVLDHLGDALYRLGKTDDAIGQWKRSWEQLSRLDASRADLRALKVTLQQKLKNVDAGKAIELAPVVEESASVPQHALNR